MVTYVLYVLKSSDVISNITAESASVVVANAARDFQVGVLILKDTGSQSLIPMQPLNVGVVTRIRNDAAAAFSRLEKESALFTKLPSDGAECLAIAQKAAQEHNIHYNELLFVISGLTVYRTPDKTRLTGLKNSQFPKKPIKVMKVFDGDFTIGDPADPSLKIGVEMYPATRRTRFPDLSSYVNDRRVTHTSTLRTDDGASVDPNSVQRGYMYLRESVLVDDDLQKLMDAEFEGAEPWPKAFEMLAVVEAVPPWMVSDKTDYIVGRTEKDQIFWEALNQASLESNNNVLARLCHEPRKGADGGRKLKGKLELVVLQPKSDGQLTCTRVPFKEEFKSYYQFSEIPKEPLPSEEDLDVLMDDLVDEMTTYEVPVTTENPTIQRVDQFLIDMMASGDAEISGITDPMKNYTLPPKAKRLADDLMKKFGIVERAGGENNPANTTNTMSNDVDSFHFI